ncbi:class I SAM-dependent methyltransferase [Streptomyces sp. Lzd4kr]|nr:class I SAM-dependent methyltransferase [Streptomyces sp. Lzd4kr]
MAVVDASHQAKGHDWRAAGAAWSRRPLDWAFLYEHYGFDVMVAIFDGLEMQPGMQVLDIACGSGLALRHARTRGVEAAGIDAAAALVEIARERSPGADIRCGTMFELPWDAGVFDAAYSINGIWGGCEAALVEAARVLKPGGLFGLSFWGDGRPLDLREVFKAMARTAPPRQFHEMKRVNNIAKPGIAESMLVEAGFEPLSRGTRQALLEWPDAQTAWRAMASPGPVVPSLDYAGESVVQAALVEAIEPFRTPGGGYRLLSDHNFLIARKRG